MATNQKLIIEFMGLPGCGKTTISNDLVVKLRAKGYKVQLLSEFQSRIFLNPVARLFHSLRFGSFQYRLKVKKYIKNQSIGKSSEGRLRYTLYIMSFYKRFLLEKSEWSILLVDQGLFQSVTSLNHGNAQLETNGLIGVVDEWNEIINHLIVLNCNIDVAQSTKRIITRNKSNGRFDKMSEDKLIGQLELQVLIQEQLWDFMNLNKINFQKFELSTEQKIDDNVSKIIGIVRKKLL